MAKEATARFASAAAAAQALRAASTALGGAPRGAHPRTRVASDGSLPPTQEASAVDSVGFMPTMPMPESGPVAESGMRLTSSSVAAASALTHPYAPTAPTPIAQSVPATAPMAQSLAAPSLGVTASAVYGEPIRPNRWPLLLALLGVGGVLAAIVAGVAVVFVLKVLAGDVSSTRPPSSATSPDPARAAPTTAGDTAPQSAGAAEPTTTGATTAPTTAAGTSNERGEPGGTGGASGTAPRRAEPIEPSDAVVPQPTDGQPTDGQPTDGQPTTASPPTASPPTASPPTASPPTASPPRRPLRHGPRAEQIRPAAHAARTATTRSPARRPLGGAPRPAGRVPSTSPPRRQRHREDLVMRSLSASLALATALWAAGAHAQDTAMQARQLFEAGVAAMDRGRVQEAASYFDQSYQLYPRASTACNMGAAQERLGQGCAAAQWYRSCESLDRGGSLTGHAHTEAERLGSQCPPAPTPSPFVGGPQPSASTPTSSTGSAPNGSVRVVEGSEPVRPPTPSPDHTLLGVGIGGVVLGGGALAGAIVSALAAQDEAAQLPDAPTIYTGTPAADHYQRAALFHDLAIGFYVGAGLVGALGLALIVVDLAQPGVFGGSASHRGSAVRLAVSPTPGGAFGRLQVEF